MMHTLNWKKEKGGDNLSPKTKEITVGIFHGVIALKEETKPGTFPIEKLLVRIDEIESFADKNPEKFRDLLQTLTLVVASKKTFNDLPRLVEFAETFVGIGESRGLKCKVTLNN